MNATLKEPVPVVYISDVLATLAPALFVRVDGNATGVY